MNSIKYRIFYPEIHNSITEEWHHCPFPSIPFLQDQARSVLSKYSSDEIHSIIQHIENYNNEAASACEDDEYIDYNLHEIRENVFFSMQELLEENNSKFAYEYMAASVLICISKMAYHYEREEWYEITITICEAYMAYADIAWRMKKEDPDRAFKNDIPLMGSAESRMYGRLGGLKSTSPLTQDKPRVIEEWERIKPQGLSRSKSADLIIDKLHLAHAHSTILTWIREYEKEKKEVQSNGST